MEHLLKRIADFHTGGFINVAHLPDEPGLIQGADLIKGYLPGLSLKRAIYPGRVGWGRSEEPQ